MSSPFLRDKNIIDVVKYKWLWIGISLFLLIPGILAMLWSVKVYHSPLKPGIDFTGGTLLEYGLKKEISSSDVSVIREELKKAGIDNPIIQVEKADKTLKEQSNPASATEPDKKAENIAQANENLSKNDINSVILIRTRFLDSEKSNNEISKVNTVLEKTSGSFIPLQVSSVGPTLGKELFKNALVALLLAFAAIVGYLSFRFKTDYAVFALLALLHDALFVCGVFAILGLLFGTEIDSLFITAILTVIGFSVHDTIVVFDRIRENSRFLAKKMSFNDVVNASVNQTLARSINTSLTALITLLALFFLGGVTTRDFVLAMTLGIAIGTYSSIFNASTLLAMWRDRKSQRKTKMAAA